MSRPILQFFGEYSMKKIAVLGPKGTFSDSASGEYIRSSDCKAEQIYYPTIDDAFHAVGEECDICIIPIENTLDGYVQRTLDLLLEMDAHIVGEITIPVKFSLIANVKTMNEIKKIYVQFKTNGQCRKFIHSLQGVGIVTTESNMESYYKIVEDDIEGEAAIIPCHMLSLSGERFKIEDVTDFENNFTRFAVIERGKDFSVENDRNKRIRIPLYVLPNMDHPGMLVEILKGFSDNKINLVSIMSRPTRKIMGTYNFYIEIEGSYEERDKILEELNRINKNYDIKILGAYSV